MKKIIFIILTVALLSCERSSTTVVEIDFKPNLIVYSALETGENFTGVRLSISTPVDKIIDTTKNIVDDADLILIKNGVQVIPLHHKQFGRYMPKNEIKLKAGEVYVLIGSWDNKYFQARTIIPNKPVAQSIENVDQLFLRARVKAYDNECYAALWCVINNFGVLEKADFFNSVETIKNRLESFVDVRTSDLDKIYWGEQFYSRTYIQFFSFDKQFSEYYKSSDRSKSIGNIFIQGGGNVIWNVKGDDVIGIFLGFSKSSILQGNLDD